MPLSDDPKRFAPGSQLALRDGRGLVVTSSRRHGNRLLVVFEGIHDRAAAESLRGPLFVNRSEVRALDEDEFWPADLIGLAVRDSSGAAVGTVTGLRPGAAQDLLVVDTPAGERLVPMVSEIVVAIDAGSGIIIDPPDGLLA